MHVFNGISINELPLPCIKDCSYPGSDATSAVEHWRDELGLTVDRAKAIACLKEYGAWEPSELRANTDSELANKILWLACGDFSEFITYCERDGIDPLNAPDGYSTPSGSDCFILE